MTDNELLSLLLKDKTREKGFSILVKNYKERIYWQVRHMVLSHDDANDLTQEIFIKIFQNIESFNKESSLSTWIYRISLNHTLNFLQSKNQRYKSNIKSLEDSMIDNLMADKYFDISDLELKLQKAILSLPEKQRMVFNLRYYDDLPFKEMAEVLNTTQSTLKSTYHFAVKKVQDMLLDGEKDKF